MLSHEPYESYCCIQPLSKTNVLRRATQVVETIGHNNTYHTLATHNNPTNRSQIKGFIPNILLTVKKRLSLTKGQESVVVSQTKLSSCE